ncbi:MAG: tRNA pseudouridine(38-40) synthase TruA [Actinobacteria bacterium]|nr:tRNA pseudouridine(38-40) synthase TruA [Actinomycetota bacterium]
MPERQTVRLDMEYDGAAFHGWAAQPGLRTVEGELRRALSPFLGPGGVVSVAGRTDRGAHATGQVVGVTLGRPQEPDRLRAALNQRLPGDVAVRSVAVVADGFDARHDAGERTYEYRLLTRSAPSPLRRERTLHVRAPLDRRTLDEGTRTLPGTHDFRAFTPVHTKHRTSTRTVTTARWEARDDELVLVIAADAFLRHMVRTIVGSLLLVARGQRRPDWMATLLDGARRSDAGPTAPARALTLVAVRYASDVGPTSPA